LKKLKIFYETDSQEKLRQAIGLLNTEIEKKSDSYKKFLFDKHISK